MSRLPPKSIHMRERLAQPGREKRDEALDASSNKSEHKMEAKEAGRLAVKAIEILAALAAALVFYKLRCKRRLWYGMLELVVAVTVMVLAVFPQRGDILLAAGPGLVGSSIEKLITMSAGIYIFVRGLDNIEVGKAGMSPVCRSLWERWF
jgi:hypothetical protein